MSSLRTRRPRRASHLLLAVSCLGLLATLLAGCGSQAPATGVARVDRHTIAAYKPCGDPDGQGIGRIDLYGSDDPDRPIWTAIHTDGHPAALQVPVTHRFPGYAITDRRPDGHLDRLQVYSFEAVSLDGKGWGGPSFRTTDLVAGKVRVGGRQVTYRTWIAAPQSCPRIGLGGALLTGLVVAGVAGGLLVGLRGLRGLSRRGRRAASPAA